MSSESQPMVPFELAVHTFTVCNETLVTSSEDVAFQTPRKQWSYALQFALPQSRPEACVIEVSIAVQVGRVGIGCVDDSISHYVTAEVFVGSEEGLVTRTILVEDISARFIIIRNAFEPSASSASLRRIRVACVSDYSLVVLRRMKAERYQYWHYAFDLGDGVVVVETLKGGMAHHRLNQRMLMRLLESNFDLSVHTTCLDAACSSGYHSFALARQGFSVTAIDIDKASIEQALFVQSCMEARGAKSVDFRQQDLLAVEIGTQYDIVFCSGLFYHLRDLVGGARKIFDVSRAGAVVHSCVSAAPGDIMELADPKAYAFCFPGEFSFVPTASLLKKIFRYVGFTDVRRYAAADLCDEADVTSLEPSYADLMRHNTAYYVVKK